MRASANTATRGYVVGALIAHTVCSNALAAPRGDTNPASIPSSAPKQLVVIDPGHGGSNTGAPGYLPFMYEKATTLPIARCVGERLRDRGIRVVYTRTEDRYVSLRERGSLANQVGADVFVSIHANASLAHDQRGFETFVLPPEALDVDGRALRVHDGPRRDHVDQATAFVLDDVERGLAQPAAMAIASAIQRNLRAIRGARYDRGVRQDAMHVLLGATMPAVLVEIGFIDHPEEGPELQKPRVQREICAALADAILAGWSSHPRPPISPTRRGTNQPNR